MQKDQSIQANPDDDDIRILPSYASSHHLKLACYRRRPSQRTVRGQTCKRPPTRTIQSIALARAAVM
ncbi:hypothetical protein LZ554_002084 [Drepanopeziza brunnea f. sp. 'monogermtubi']|nr:hypothetical protein LZ554_002084 [Drepanopeziza brunnea f. sp. 'monogermtubi']